jgi:hypothetical protein
LTGRREFIRRALAGNLLATMAAPAAIRAAVPGPSQTVARQDSRAYWFGMMRQIRAGASNWLLFPAMIEAFFATAGAEWLPEPIDRALSAHESWYKGDGVYGDGNDFHWDYYNSYVIQPFLATLLAEPYISTGSLYLFSLVFHPLGLPGTNRFWRDPDMDWTQHRIWSGADAPADHANQET